MSNLSEINSEKDLLEFIAQDAMPNGNLSIRGVARLADVDRKSVARGGDLNNEKLRQMLAKQGFLGGDLIEFGFPPQAVILALEYFAYESKATAEGAKAILRTFGVIGLMKTLSEITQAVTTTSVEVAPDLTEGILDLGIQTAVFLKQSQKEVKAKLDNLHNLIFGSAVDVKGEIREGNHELSEQVKTLSQRLEATPNAPRQNKVKTTTNETTITFAVRVPIEQAADWIEVIDQSGFSRSRYITEALQPIMQQRLNELHGGTK